MKCLKKITNLALANEWIAKDPFIGIKFHEKEVIREFLTMDELLTIYHKEFPLERITVVRDVFIFCRPLPAWLSLTYNSFPLSIS